MKILIVSDSFKHALNSLEVGNAIKSGLEFSDDFQVDVHPISDGGEGFIEVVRQSLEVREISRTVCDPLQRIIKATYLIEKDQNRAFIEMASASGIELLEKNERAPLKTSSFGTGQLIYDAISRGCKQVILGVGGSATVDGGIGILSALGVKFTGYQEQIIIPKASELTKISSINTKDIPSVVLETEIVIATDVENTILGDKGAAKVFAPQKGASPEEVIILEQNLSHFTNLIENTCGGKVVEIKGGGAAGGIGIGLQLLPKTKIISGFNWVSELINLEEKIIQADLIITGEGRMDNQTVYGKVPSGIAQLTKKHKKHLIGVCGQLGKGYEKLYELGFNDIIPLNKKVTNLEEALRNTQQQLKKIGVAIGQSL